ncbi:hypothetical protein EVAR_10651_1 [Eumeta japonica]|uniref:Uncharacterized protein n=1 Tax=Eumeta variegata TaxID=151549 RepID=A0A4C1U6Y9_EUMVA|nr:hypothetical protein EVAR_10651_1 [Eumeta japonica]
MPIGRDRRSPQSSNLSGLRTTANQQVDSGVFWSVKVGHTPRTRGANPIHTCFTWGNVLNTRRPEMADLAMSKFYRPITRVPHRCPVMMALSVIGSPFTCHSTPP